ncbi:MULTISPECIES: hypothetical protein [Caballeronia]|uniref:Alginate regulatory protein AlgP n=1 Tax=Caballeronia jiangsuensis TaxID=1458357 RepID=A0ABW9CZ31_9BURK|nr:hypothetical protein [Caballeronia sp. GaOx3]
MRAVEAARGVTRHFQEPSEVARVRWSVRPRRREPRLPAPATAAGTVVIEPQRASNSILATVAMGGVVISACFLIRAYFEQHPSTARAAGLPVAVAGSVGQQNPPKVDVAPQRIVEATHRGPANSSAETPSPLMAVAASSEVHDTPPVVVPERPVAAKHPASRAQHAVKAATKTVSKADSKAVSKVASKAKPTAACAHKAGRACTEPPQRRVASAEPKNRQAAKSPSPAPVARTKTAPKEFQKVAAIPAPVKPAMTTDGSWKPGKTKN